MCEHIGRMQHARLPERGFLPSKRQLRLASFQIAGSALSVCCVCRSRLLNFPISCLDTTVSNLMLDPRD